MRIPRNTGTSAVFQKRGLRIKSLCCLIWCWPASKASMGMKDVTSIRVRPLPCPVCAAAPVFTSMREGSYSDSGRYLFRGSVSMRAGVVLLAGRGGRGECVT